LKLEGLTIAFLLVGDFNASKPKHTIFDIPNRQLIWKKVFHTSYVGFMTDGAQWFVDNTDIKLVV
jgi:hypothetical protein